MSWIAEWIIQGFWDGVVEVAYRKGGWLSAAIVLIVPPAIVILIVWLIVR